MLNHSQNTMGLILLIFGRVPLSDDKYSPAKRGERNHETTVGAGGKCELRSFTDEASATWRACCV